MTLHSPGGSVLTAQATEIIVDGNSTLAQENGSIGAPYQTIAAALAAAAAGDTIKVKYVAAGYTEDLTLVDGVHLEGESGPRGDSPFVTGTATATDVGCSIRNMSFIDDGAGNAFYFTGTAAETITLVDCVFTTTATGDRALEMDNTAGGIVANNCQFANNAANISEVVRIESGTFNAFDLAITHGSNILEALVAEGDAATTVNIQNFTITGSVNSEAAVANPAMTLKGGTITVGAISGLIIAAGNTVNVYDCEISSTDAAQDAVDGAGSLTATNLRFTSTADEVATTITLTAHANSRMQTGTVAAAGASPQTDAVVFPIVFPSTSYKIFLTAETTGGAADDINCSVDEGTIATTGFSIITTTIGAAAVGCNIHWLAIHD